MDFTQISFVDWAQMIVMGATAILAGCSWVTRNSHVNAGRLDAQQEEVLSLQHKLELMQINIDSNSKHWQSAISEHTQHWQSALSENTAHWQSAIESSNQRLLDMRADTNNMFARMDVTTADLGRVSGTLQSLSNTLNIIQEELVKRS